MWAGGPGASDQSPEPLVWTVEGDFDRAVNRIELNRIDSFAALTRIESFSFWPNRPSLLSIYVAETALIADLHGDPY